MGLHLLLNKSIKICTLHFAYFHIKGKTEFAKHLWLFVVYLSQNVFFPLDSFANILNSPVKTKKDFLYRKHYPKP